MVGKVGNPEENFEQLMNEQRQHILTENPVLLVEKVYQLWWHWADFHLFIISPTIDIVFPPLLLPAEPLPNGEKEFVYPIHDHGYKLSTSKGEEMYSAGMSMCKLYFTIEKMIYILVERLKSGGIGTDVEVQVAFGGHELAQRKAFEVIINLGYNVVVTNFDPGPWGEHYLRVVQGLAAKGYGYPSEAPRDSFRHPRSASPSAKR